MLGLHDRMNRLTLAAVLVQLLPWNGQQLRCSGGDAAYGRDGRHAADKPVRLEACNVLDVGRGQSGACKGLFGWWASTTGSIFVQAMQRPSAAFIMVAALSAIEGTQSLHFTSLTEQSIIPVPRTYSVDALHAEQAQVAELQADPAPGNQV